VSAVDEAVAWFRGRPDEVDFCGSSDNEQHATVIVRAVLSGELVPAAGSDTSIVTKVCDELGIERDEVVETTRRHYLIDMAFDECVRHEVARRLAARSDEPCCDDHIERERLGAALVEIGMALGLPRPSATVRWGAPEILERIRSAGDTTETTTEYRAVLTSNRKSCASADGVDGLTDLRDAFGRSLDSGSMVIESRTVSPWAPVDEQNGAQA
jgi:hypothetical protein